MKKNLKQILAGFGLSALVISALVGLSGGKQTIDINEFLPLIEDGHKIKIKKIKDNCATDSRCFIDKDGISNIVFGATITNDDKVVFDIDRPNTIDKEYALKKINTWLKEDDLKYKIN